MEIQEGDPNVPAFSFEDKLGDFKQEPCYLTYTNEKHMKLSEKIYIGLHYMQEKLKVLVQDIVLLLKIKL